MGAVFGATALLLASALPALAQAGTGADAAYWRQRLSAAPLAEQSQMVPQPDTHPIMEFPRPFMLPPRASILGPLGITGAASWRSSWSRDEVTQSWTEQALPWYSIFLGDQGNGFPLAKLTGDAEAGLQKSHDEPAHCALDAGTQYCATPPGPHADTTSGAYEQFLGFTVAGMPVVVTHAVHLEDGPDYWSTSWYDRSADVSYALVVYGCAAGPESCDGTELASQFSGPDLGADNRAGAERFASLADSFVRVSLK